MNAEDTTSAEYHRDWRGKWLVALHQFADYDLHRKMWLDPTKTNPHWSYVEFMSKYFSNILLQDDYGWAFREKMITLEEADAVQSLHELLLVHQSPGGDDWNNQAILEDPAWRAITREAATVQAKLATLLTHPEERRLLPCAD